MPVDSKIHKQSSPQSFPPDPAKDLAGWFDHRADLRDEFLRQNAVYEPDLKPMGEDCAFRRYFRVHDKQGRSMILMEAIPDGHSAATPGHSLKDFVDIGRFLRDHGIRAPMIYALDPVQGYALLEDFGDVSFKAAAESGQASLDDLYGLAVEVLGGLNTLDPAAEDGLALPSYYESHVHKGRRRVVEWYMPVVLEQRLEAGAVDEYLSIWQRIEEAAGAPCPQGLLHVDFHMENLMYMPQAKGTDRCGVLDYQGAMTGPFVYDLGNLLEDPRYEIDAVLRKTLYTNFYESLPVEKQAGFARWYRILATQFHCRVIGQFIKLALAHDKPGYMQYIPRLEGYLRQGLQDPALKELSDWFTAHGIDFSSGMTEINQQAMRYIADDAF